MRGETRVAFRPSRFDRQRNPAKKLHTSLGERLTELGREVVQPAHEGILLEDDLPVPAGVYLQRVSLTNTHSAPNLLGNDHPSQIIDAAHHEANQAIQTLAGYTMLEGQIENLVVAKGYVDCVAFMVIRAPTPPP